MYYKIKCDNCGLSYKIEAQGGRTIRSVCPHCGHKMLVNLPDVETVNGQPLADDGVKNTPEQKQKKSGSWRWILLAIFFGLAVGGGIWAFLQHHEKAEAEERIALKKARKAHMDSLMQLRNQQEAEEREARESQQNQQMVEDFLTQFYNDCFFGYVEPSVYSGNLSEKCYQKMSGNTDAADEGSSDDIEWSQLGPHFDTEDADDAYKEELKKNFRIEHDRGNWYRVCFQAHGATDYRLVEAVPYKGKVIINDYR